MSKALFTSAQGPPAFWDVQPPPPELRCIGGIPGCFLAACNRRPFIGAGSETGRLVFKVRACACKVQQYMLLVEEADCCGDIEVAWVTGQVLP